MDWLIHFHFKWVFNKWIQAILEIFLQQDKGQKNENYEKTHTKKYKLFLQFL